MKLAKLAQLRFWPSGSLLELKWYHYIQVEPDSHLSVLLASILGIYKVFYNVICYTHKTFNLAIKCKYWILMKIYDHRSNCAFFKLLSF